MEQIMETYQRRRIRKCNETSTEMGQQSCKNSVLQPSLTATSDHRPVFQLKSANVDHEIPPAVFLSNNIQVEVGSVYEIDHIHLPHRTPVQLRSIRVVMVSEKTELNVAVRFPSMESLKTYFSNSTREMYPALDEKFVMGTALAAKVLRFQVPSQQFAENKHLEGFWLVNADTVDVCGADNGYKKGNCLTELKVNGMVRWGIRRQVMFLERHKENINDNVQSSLSFDLEGSKEDTKLEETEKPDETNSDNDGSADEDHGEKDDEQQEDDEDDNEREYDKEAVDDSEGEGMGEEARKNDRNLKRKRYKPRNSTRHNTKKIKIAKKKLKQKLQNKKKSHGKKGRNRCRELLVIENPKDRWSAERYQIATKNLLEVMKAKGATASNPILRPDLRSKARKKIGDTGLLDHLLKHMAGKLAPGGEERFRRRHNADGAMEYWLESANLVNIRKEAGVNDPFWVPPPGWKPGDCPTQDPISAKELKLLKEEIHQLKRNARDMVPRKQLEQELGKLRREIDNIVSNKIPEENIAIQVFSNPCEFSHMLDQLGNALAISNYDLAKAPVSLEKYKEQLLVIQDFVKGIEEEIKMLLAEDNGGKTWSNSAMIVSKGSGEEKQKQPVQLEEDRTKEQEEVQEVINASREEEEAITVTAAKAVEKAAKIERLKSGFRICKPQGTFLWPNMVARNNNNNVNNNSVSSSNSIASPHQVVVQVDHQDVFMVPTPPSVSSSTALVFTQLPNNGNRNIPPPSPVKKPLAERRAVTVTVSTLSNEYGDNCYSTTTNTTANKSSSPINLNDLPSTHSVGFCGSPLSSQPPLAAVGMMPLVVPEEEGKKARRRSWEVMNAAGGAKEAKGGGHVQKKLSKCCPSTTSASYLSTEKEMGMWLALATANSDDSSLG